MPNINILDNLLGAFFEAAFGKTANALENRHAFVDDLRTFLNDQEKHTQLDVFLFSRRPKYGSEENPDDFITLEEIYIPLRLEQIRGTLPNFQEFREKPQRYEGLRDQKIKDLNIAGLLDLMHNNEHFRKVMILGTAGSGKSTFMKYLTRLLVADKNRKVKVLEKKGKGEKGTEISKRVQLKAVPIFIRLRDLEKRLVQYGRQDWEQTYSIIDFTAAQCGQPVRTDHFYIRLFHRIPCIFLLDGIDEVPEQKIVDGISISRKRVMEWLLRQIKHLEKENAEVRFILTSRPTDTGYLAHHFQIFSAKNFDRSEIEIFTEYWYLGCEKSFRANAEYETRDHKREKWRKRCEKLPERKAQFLEYVSRPPLNEIVENPLLLSLALFMHALEERFSVENKEKLYERFSEAFLYEWDEVRDMDFYPELFGSGHYERLYELTYRLAYHFSKNQTTTMTVRDLLPAVGEAIGRYHLIPVHQLGESALELLHAFYERNGLLYGREASDDFLDTVFEFQHKSFQDFLCAQCISSDRLIENEEFTFEAKIGHDFWDRTLEFYVNLPSPDFFFKKTIESIRPGSPVARNIHIFCWHFLKAQQKKQELTDRLAEKIADLFMKSKLPSEIFLSTICLARLPDTSGEALLHMIETWHEDDLEAFRSGKAIWLLAKKGKYLQIRQILKRKISAITNEYQPANFIELCIWQTLPLAMKDKELFSHCLHIYSKSLQKNSWIVLFYLQDLLDCMSLRDVNRDKGVLNLRDLSDLLDLHGVNNIQYMQYIRTVKDRWGGWGLSESEHLFYSPYLGDLRYLWDLRELLVLSYGQDLLNLRYLRQSMYGLDSLLGFLIYLRNKLNVASFNPEKIQVQLLSALKVLECLSDETNERFFIKYKPIPAE